MISRTKRAGPELRSKRAKSYSSAAQVISGQPFLLIPSPETQNSTALAGKPSRSASPRSRLILIPRQRLAGEVEGLENVATESEKIGATTITRAIQLDRDNLLNFAGTLSHDDDSIAHVDRL